ncbi:hypothetical protein Athai_34230 [Actinocatenispora thailandica]|uniref:Orc1-like AAA ATPase domain-containing protein n=1 Tax=Actinocatenispora thailandica TaxID=227318 RepID=A0A7R7DQ99_9ACTN|nr:ATP-binding protein [Actinocatenispora thailandica]BCJ35920.1 hypothetical protein Athai_34230 [Actinocatenispora thailandica]
MLPLVGRTDELRAVSAAWRTLRDEPARCRIVVITGEIGAGKSRLAAEAVAALSPPPGPVLTGQARAHQPAPYDLTASALSGRGAAELGISVDALAWLTQRPEPATRRFAPEALLRTAVDAIRSLHRAGPGVLVVEDLHDLDPASLEVVDELAAAPTCRCCCWSPAEPPVAWPVGCWPGCAAPTAVPGCTSRRCRSSRSPRRCRAARPATPISPPGCGAGPAGIRPG